MWRLVERVFWHMVIRKRQLESTWLRSHFRRRYNIVVGLYSYGCFDPWRMRGPMTVGRYCSIAASVLSVRANHPIGALSTHPMLYDKDFGVVDRNAVDQAPLVIEDDVWIGHNVIILPGCARIGRGAVVGAGSVVTRDVPRYAVVAGNPARRLRDRFTAETMAALEASEWWLLDKAELAALVRRRPELASEPTAERLRDGWPCGQARLIKTDK